MAETPDRHGPKPRLRTVHLLLMTAIGLSYTALSQAQEPAPETGPAAVSGEPVEGTAEPAAEDLIDPAIADTAADQESVLEDYEASEQISEDLSVSFPVDI